ncbi:transposase [Enterococcus plantarum]|uniref:transposase n=1 Tax=Enterococcus plantarum TaxID=1077675 RepID=UPI001A8CB044|nr:transposase [Enterococcus plantarum]MBO0467942.1 transposase [Enterococcus plantarum]
MSEIARQKKGLRFFCVSRIETVLRTEKNQSTHLARNPFFRAYLTEIELVDRLLAYVEELKAGYTCYQNFLYTIKTRDYTRFHALLEQDHSSLPAYYQTTITTFKKVQTGIKNALDLPYSNGLLE